MPYYRLGDFHMLSGAGKKWEKGRNGAFWEDCYHTTAIEDGDHIQKPRRKNVMIDYDKFMELLGTENYDQARRDHQRWIGEFMGNDPGGRDDKWTDSIAV